MPCSRKCRKRFLTGERRRFVRDNGNPSPDKPTHHTGNGGIERDEAILLASNVYCTLWGTPPGVLKTVRCELTDKRMRDVELLTSFHDWHGGIKMQVDKSGVYWRIENIPSE